MIEETSRKPISKMRMYLKYGFVMTEQEIYLCPSCKGILNAGPNYQPKYCGQCGQRLDFLGIKWKKDKKLGFVEERCDKNESE